MRFELRNLAFSTRERVAFISLLASGAFIILLSSDNLLGPYLSGNFKASIYFLPWILLWPLYSFELLTNKTRRVEIVLIGTVIIFGVLNVIFSQNPLRSYQSMRLFLLTGVFPLWASIFLFTNRPRRNLFAAFCCGCLLIVIPVEIIHYFLKGGGKSSSINLFVHNPIPVGTLLILLSIGPFYCLLSACKNLKMLGWFLLAAGLTLILLTEKRGTFIALAAMLAVWMFFWRSKYKSYVLAILLAAIVITGVKVWPHYRNLNENNLSHFTIMHRLELYPFAFHIFESHPFFGIGLRSHVHENYLIGYQQLIKQHTHFAEYVKELQTFDNMILTGIVELGSLMTFVYLSIIMLLIFKYCKKAKPFSSNGEELFLVLPLIGLAAHSFTYDSLLFPQINWLAHVQLGILVGYICDGQLQRNCT